MRYLGKLSYNDPLYVILSHEVLPQLVGQRGQFHPAFSVYQLFGSNQVYLYREEHTSAELIGKFFTNPNKRKPAHGRKYMEREFHALSKMRSLGFDQGPHRVIRPLGCYPHCNALLVQEYSRGIPLSYYIDRALVSGKHEELRDKLRVLAYFLARWHNSTATEGQIPLPAEFDYFHGLINRLRQNHVGKEEEYRELINRAGRWYHKPCMWEDCLVFVHGDPTPANLLFGKGLEVIAIDLERCKYTDRAFDLGRIAAELKHHFLQKTKDPLAAEDLISYFLWEYSCHFPDRQAAFHSITARLPFYMAQTLLRIAPNAWVPKDQKKRLIQQALLTLEV